MEMPEEEVTINLSEFRIGLVVFCICIALCFFAFGFLVGHNRADYFCNEQWINYTNLSCVCSGGL